MPSDDTTPTSKAFPIQIGETSYLSLSYGVLWTIAGAMFLGLGLMIAGVREGQQFLDHFTAFQASTLKYEKIAQYDEQVMNIKLTNVQEWQRTADVRRKANYSDIVTQESLEDTLQAVAANNSDLKHIDSDRQGLTIPAVIMKPLVQLPEAMILPLPNPPPDLGDFTQ